MSHPKNSPGEHLTDSLITDILERGPVADFGPGEVIVRQGDESDSAYFVTSGEVIVEAEAASGAVPLATLKAPRLIGEIGALTGLPRTATVRAAGPVRLYQVDRHQLHDLGRRKPDLLLSIIGQLGREIEAVNKAIGFYTSALSALEERKFDVAVLASLRNPPPELASFAVVFERFAREIQAKHRKADELASAALIQQSFLPKASVLARPGAARLDAHAAMRPAREVGGDFYDYFWLDDRRLAFAVGDICGKGLPASLFAAMVITALRTAAHDAPTLADALLRANEVLCRDNAAGLFATAFCGVLDVETGTLTYGNCGHNAPMIIAADGSVTDLPATGLPLALYDDRAAATAAVSLDPGAALIVFTDGLTEAFNVHGEEYGDARLAADAASICRAETTAAEFVTRLIATIDTFVGDAEQADDMTCLVLRR